MKKNTKSVTIDNLAIMVAKGISRSDEQFAKIDKQFESVEENFKKVRNDILNVGDRFVPRHEFDNRTTR